MSDVGPTEDMLDPTLEQQQQHGEEEGLQEYPDPDDNNNRSPLVRAMASAT